MSEASRDANEISARLDGFIAEYPETRRLELMIVDMNGVLRGKWLPVDSAKKIASGDVKLPVSTSALDMWGHDVEGSGLGIVSGDKDGVLRPVLPSLTPVPWGKAPSAQMLMVMDDVDGQPSQFDPRARLADVVARFADAGLIPVVATELEFFLIKSSELDAEAPRPADGAEGSHLYDFEQMALFEPVLNDIRDGCEALGIPADAIIAESGVGQYEINFNHVADPLKAADFAVLFRRLVRGVARDHGLNATFMAKPYGEHAGSGMHVHASVLDANGENLFADAAKLSGTLRYAMGGLLKTMADLQLIFAPTLNSYRRFSREGFAPTQANWGYDHRAAAVRVPEFKGAGARFEHRVSGADVNPYLALAAILGGALMGLEQKIDPGRSMDDDAAATFGELSWDWMTAVNRYEASDTAREIFGPDFVRVYSLVKRDEIAQLNRQISDVEFRTYMGRI